MNKIILTVLVLFSATLTAQTWQQLANAPIGRHHPISFALNGKGYAVTGSLANGSPTNAAFSYDPGTDSWSTLSPFPGAARSFGIGAVANDIAYIGFGATSTQYLNDFWSFDATTGTWTQLANCGCSGRRHPAMISIGNRIYVGLGDDATGDRNDWWMYDITSDSWSQIANLPGPARHHPYMFNAAGELFAGLGHSQGTIYKDWYKLDTASNTWSSMNQFPGEARVAGTQFKLGGYGFVLSGDGDDHNYMATGEMWRYNPSNDTWKEFPPHPGQSRWAPGSFVIDENVYFFGGRNRFLSTFPNDLWKFDMAAATVGIEEEVLTNTYIFPNPANDMVYWEYDQSITEIQVYNVMGQLVLTSTSKAQQLSTQALTGGLYLVQFYDNSTLVKTSKMIIQH